MRMFLLTKYCIKAERHEESTPVKQISLKLRILLGDRCFNYRLVRDKSGPKRNPQKAQGAAYSICKRTDPVHTNGPFLHASIRRQLENCLSFWPEN